MENPAREMTFLLAGPERRLLRGIAARLPARMRPNHLTAIGVVGALGTGAGYALSTWHPAWLWLASAMLVVNWFGDSLDGTLARVRQIERPKYGYYIDHAVDAFTTMVIGLGLGLSPFVRVDVALVLVVVYLILSINVYLESAVFGVFRMAYGIFGPTEARIMLILVNTLLFVGIVAWNFLAASVSVVMNAVFVLLALAMFIMLLARFGRNLRRLSRQDPRKR